MTEHVITFRTLRLGGVEQTLTSAESHMGFLCHLIRQPDTMEARYVLIDTETGTETLKGSYKNVSPR